MLVEAWQVCQHKKVVPFWWASNESSNQETYRKRCCHWHSGGSRRYEIEAYLAWAWHFSRLIFFSFFVFAVLRWSGGRSKTSSLNLLERIVLLCQHHNADRLVGCLIMAV
jgi:hypothetical protein